MDSERIIITNLSEKDMEILVVMGNKSIGRVIKYLYGFDVDLSDEEAFACKKILKNHDGTIRSQKSRSKKKEEVVAEVHDCNSIATKNEEICCESVANTMDCNNKERENEERERENERKERTKEKKDKEQEREAKEQENSARVREVIDYLNDKTGSSFRATTDVYARNIKARIKEGATLDDFMAVIDCKVRDWGESEKMRDYLRPQTLFGTKFDSYLQDSKRKPVQAFNVADPNSYEQWNGFTANSPPTTDYAEWNGFG